MILQDGLDDLDDVLFLKDPAIRPVPQHPELGDDLRVVGAESPLLSACVYDGRPGTEDIHDAVEVAFARLLVRVAGLGVRGRSGVQRDRDRLAENLGRVQVDLVRDQTDLAAKRTRQRLVKDETADQQPVFAERRFDGQCEMLLVESKFTVEQGHASPIGSIAIERPGRRLRRSRSGHQNLWSPVRERRRTDGVLRRQRRLVNGRPTGRDRGRPTPVAGSQAKGFNTDHFISAGEPRSPTL